MESNKQAVQPQLIREDEPQRLEAVRRYDILDTPPDGAFERITQLAARHFETPIAIVSIVDHDRIWFKSHHGIDAEQIGRDPGLCASAILDDQPWIVEDARNDPRTMANPLVAGELGLGFYAGAPLKTSDGHNLGTLCVIDQQPREFSESDQETLTDLAAIVMDELELRLAARETVGKELALREMAERIARELQASLLPGALPEIEGAELSALFIPADAGEVGGDFYDIFKLGSSYGLAVGDVSGKGAAAAATTALTRNAIRAAALGSNTPADMLGVLNRTMLLDRPTHGIDRFCTAIVGFLDRSDDGGFSLKVASAGHPPALVFRSDGSIEAIAGVGPPAGWFEEANFNGVTCDLRSGDRVLFYTDGLIESRRAGTMLSEEGLRARLHQAGESAADLTDTIRTMIDDGELDVRDDIAMLVLKVN